MAVLGALAILLVSKVLGAAALFERPGELTIPAAANVYVAKRVQEGGVVYGDWRERPHVAAWYGPALYLPPGYIGRWIDADVHDLFMIGRWISLLSVVGTAGLIAWMISVRWAVHPLIAAGMVLAFVTCDELLQRYDFSFRPDAPACLFTMLGLALLVRSDRPASLYGSVFVFLLAFLYKQTAIAGPPAVVAWLWLTGRQRQAGSYAGLTAALFIGTVVLLGLVTSGRYYLNTVDALKGNVALVNVPFMLFKAAETAVLPLALTAFVVAVQWSRREWRLETILFASSLVLAAVGTYRDGSGLYYYMLPVAVGCVLCGRQLGQWWQERSRVPVAATALTISLALAAVRYVPQATFRLVELPQRWRAFEQCDQQHRLRADFYRQLAEYLNSLDGPVLCQFNTMGLYCPRSIMIDTFTFTTMADVKVFDDRPLIAQIRQGQVAAIVFNPKVTPQYQSTDMFSRRWIEAMKGRYRQINIPRLSAARVYLPISRTGTGTTDLLGAPG